VYLKKEKTESFSMAQTSKVLNKEHSRETCLCLSQDVVKMHLSLQVENLSNGGEMTALF